MQSDIDPFYRDIEEHIRRAKAERAVAIAEDIADGFAAIARGVEQAIGFIARIWSSRRSRIEQRTLAAR